MGNTGFSEELAALEEENFSDKEIAAIRDYINSKKQTKL